MLLREGDEIAVEVEVRNAGSRIRRIADDDRDRFRDRMLYRSLEGAEEGGVGLDGDRTDSAARHQKPEDVDRVGGVGNDDDIARRSDRLGDIGKAFLRAERGDDLRFWIELHAEAAGVVGGLGTAQARYALGRRIAVGARP